MTRTIIYEDTNGAVVAQGLTDVVNALQLAGASAKDLKDVFAPVSKFVASEARKRAPRGESRRLAGSLRGLRRKNAAIVRGGGKRAPYAKFAAYGAPRKHHAPNAFMYLAIAQNNTRIVSMVKDGLGDLITKTGLPTTL